MIPRRAANYFENKFSYGINLWEWYHERVLNYSDLLWNSLWSMDDKNPIKKDSKGKIDKEKGHLLYLPHRRMPFRSRNPIMLYPTNNYIQVGCGFAVCWMSLCVLCQIQSLWSAGRHRWHNLLAYQHFGLRYRAWDHAAPIWFIATGSKW